MKHLASDRWYRPDTWSGETFLMLSSQEVAYMDRNKLAFYLGEPIKELSFEDFRIFVYDENIASKLPSWDSYFHLPFTFSASTDYPHLVGRFVENYNENGPALIAEKGEVGYLAYGPYVDVYKGKYVVTFDISAQNNPEGVVRIDVDSSAGQLIHADAQLLESDGLQELRIDLEEDAGALEFRVWAMGNEKVVFRSVEIVRIDENRSL